MRSTLARVGVSAVQRPGTYSVPALRPAGPGTVLLLAAWLGVSLVGCTQSRIDVLLRDQEAPVGGSAGTSGEGGNGPAPVPAKRCTEGGTVAQKFVAFRNVLSGLCVEQGLTTDVGPDVAFEVRFGDCVDSNRQVFELIPDDGALALRSVSTAYNLDVNFAGSDDGTIVILYKPSPFFNQRFYLHESGDGRAAISPRHAPMKCLSMRESGLELWPCVPGAADQTYDLLACGED